jgi:arabinofuranosyltransferase
MDKNPLREWLSRHPHLVVPLLLFCIHALYYFGWSLDDPYISYRYAENLANGHGLVFNPGEYVEGYSNFLFTVLLAVLCKAGLNIVDFSRLIGFLSGLATIILVYRFLQRFRTEYGSGGEGAPGSHGLLSHLALYLLALSGPFALWAVSGLETGFYTFLAVAAWYYFSRERRLGARDLVLTQVFLLGTALARPDGILFAAAITLVIFVLRQRRLQGRSPDGPAQQGVFSSGVRDALPRGAALYGLIFLIPYILYTYWRYRYYGDLLPNTFYAKATGEPRFQLADGVAYTVSFFKANGHVLLLMAVVAFVLSPLRFARAYLSSLLILIVFVAMIIYCGGDWMPASRFFVPVLPFLFFLVQEGVRTVWERVKVSDPLYKKRDLIAVLLVAILIGNLYFERKETRLLVYGTRTGTLYQQYVDMGKWMRAILPPDSVFAGAEAGILPYYSKLRFIDMLGIIDPHVAKLPGGLHEKYSAEYVLGRKPDYIVLHVHIQPDRDSKLVGYYPWTREMLADPQFQENYEILQHFIRGNDLFGRNLMLLYERKGSN